VSAGRAGVAAATRDPLIDLALGHPFAFELADVGRAAIEVTCQRRHVDGRGLSESRSSDRLGNGRTISCDGLGTASLLWVAAG
jgi:hypothetical protein